MSEEVQVLIRLSAALGAGDRRAVRAVVEDARTSAPGEQVEEALLQAYLFVGFPPVLEAFAVWRGDGPGGGRAADGPTDRDPRGRDELMEDGRATCRRVYGRTYRELRRNVAGLHPELDRWMVREGYGKVLSRPGLDLPARELCIVALLAGAGWPRQLHSHLRGALRVGVESQAVVRALEAGLEARRRRSPRPEEPTDWEERAREIWKRVRGRRRQSDGRSAS